MKDKLKNDRVVAAVSAPALAVAAAFALAAAAPAHAGISFVDTFRNNNFTQTSNDTASSAGSFLTLHLFATQPSEFTTVLAFYPGPDSPAALTENVPQIYGYSTPLYPNQASMDTAFPMGAYTFTANSPTEALTTSFNYAADAYPLTVPYLAGTNYSSLQGMNASQPFTFQLSAFTPNAFATDSFTFLTIFETVSGDVAYDFGFQPSSTTMLTLPANTLTPGVDYTYELIYSDRVTVPSPGADFAAQLGFDERTDGSFTPTIPEPCSALLAFTGGTALLRRRRRPAAPRSM